MEIEDFAEGPVGVAVAASAVVFSPQVRRVLRRGLVLGVAGVLTAGDAVTGFVRGVRRSAGNGADAGITDLESEPPDEAELGEQGEPQAPPAVAARAGPRARRTTPSADRTDRP
jgi:hypothetical protein